jgi:predicted small secreted protein
MTDFILGIGAGVGIGLLILNSVRRKKGGEK